MEKRGLIGIIILSVLGVLVAAGAGTGVYFYKYHVFEELRACVGNWEDTNFPCESREDCLAAVNFSDEMLVDAPDFVKENFDRVLDSVVYCEQNCFVGRVRGINYETGELEGLEYCEEGEDEFVMQIHGDEGLEILAWMEKMRN